MLRRSPEVSSAPDEVKVVEITDRARSARAFNSGNCARGVEDVANLDIGLASVPKEIEDNAKTKGMIDVPRDLGKLKRVHFFSTERRPSFLRIRRGGGGRGQVFFQ